MGYNFKEKPTNFYRIAWLFLSGPLCLVTSNYLGKVLLKYFEYATLTVGTVFNIDRVSHDIYIVSCLNCYIKKCISMPSNEVDIQQFEGVLKERGREE